MSVKFPVMIIGAGPAGLSAARGLSKKKIPSLVLEKGDKVGGIARTETYRGFRFDIGGHRFFSKDKNIQKIWDETLGSDFLPIKRTSRIYHQGQFFNYPIELFNVLEKMGFLESIRIPFSYIKAKLFAGSEPRTLEEWLIYHFGGRLYRTFFKSYTERVWGIPCNQIDAEWAFQRIKGLSVKTALTNSLFKTDGSKSLIKNFYFPRLGSGMMWEKMAKDAGAGSAELRLNTKVIKIHHNENQIFGITVKRSDKTEEITGEHFISSMPLPELVAAFDPQPPSETLRAAENLEYRSFILVGIIINGNSVFPDNWIYIHTPEVKVCRIQNIINWSAEMVPVPGKASLGMEYFCNEGDDMWESPDTFLIDQASKELKVLGLVKKSQIEDGVVFRQAKAYPVYTNGYREHIRTIRRFIDKIENLQSIGRNGMHRYNNMDHSMIMGHRAAKNIMGFKCDLWRINHELAYQEI